LKILIYIHELHFFENIILLDLNLFFCCNILDKLFFDYNAAGESSSFKKVFSKGSPTFDFQFFELIDNKLLVVYMLHAHCINIDTGEIIWSMQL